LDIDGIVRDVSHHTPVDHAFVELHFDVGESLTSPVSNGQFAFHHVDSRRARDGRAWLEAHAGAATQKLNIDLRKGSIRDLAVDMMLSFPS
jgi:hypothetical protein